MNIDDYLFTYFSILEKTAGMIPTYDQVVLADLQKHNQKFVDVAKKYDQEVFDRTVHQIFVELVNEVVFKGNIGKDDIIISNNTPMSFEILQHIGDQQIWEAMKATQDQWDSTPLTQFVKKYILNL
ncbi:MAG: hypothetical protein Q3959_06285 [Limosilactobacillus sp.]|uniref:hypothetical protein n=1 Tax=Limosilactobacillus sp. TaxID=2773925 RepID=UPI00270C0BA6|nr:hypothetical protein [Limosilactobacillus sp.]